MYIIVPSPPYFLLISSRKATWNFLGTVQVFHGRLCLPFPQMEEAIFRCHGLILYKELEQSWRPSLFLLNVQFLIALSQVLPLHFGGCTNFLSVAIK